MEIICTDGLSQELPVDGFRWVKENDLSNSNEKFVKSYNEKSDKGYFLEVVVKYPKNLHKLHSDLPFLPERKKKQKKSKSLFVLEKEKYVIHIRALKQALNRGLILEKVQIQFQFKVQIQFNQKAWLKPFIDMNTKLRKEAKKDLEKVCLS